MRIEELIIDGFKSYAARTVITDWDPQFNAITGLNGSGKSNILDSICFVLGISSMSTVRASNLQDLIYKRGQAGVTKASVTIVFDNSDKSKSPIGFNEHSKISITRQVVMGGTSKYLINGHRAQQQTVLQLFQSVQLNINNPNFLIMQGKITKVLNMPPSQILALIAEAAGTKLFEDRREKAVKTMAKKDTKLTEIKTLLLEEIEPKLEKLRKEKKAFLEFQQTQSELDKLSRVVNAHDYTNYAKKLDEFMNKSENDKYVVETLDKDIERLTNEIATLQEDLDKVKKLKEKEFKKGGKLQTLEENETELSNELVRLNTSLSIKQESLNAEIAKNEKNKANLTKLTKEFQSKSETFSKVNSDQNEAKNQLQVAKESIQKKEELLATLQTGVSAKGKSGGYIGQLKEVKQNLSDSNVKVQQLTLQMNRLKQDNEVLKPKLEAAAKDLKQLDNELVDLKSKRDQLATSLSQNGFDPNKLRDLKAQERDLKQKIYRKGNDIDSLKRTVSALDFNYTKPYPDFNTRSIKGIAANLVHLSNDKYDSATALEVCAGGKLYNVVVDNEVTGSQLLEKGRLRKRVTIIPLNKISARQLSSFAVQKAKDMCPGKVELALHLVGYESEVTKAMEYIFGTTLITADPETSKRVTFDPQIRAKSVTLAGDVYDPNGTLSGGSRRQSGSILITVQKYNEMLKEMAQMKEALRLLEIEISKEETISEQTSSLQKELSLSEHAVSLAQRKSDSSPANQLKLKYTENCEYLEKIEAQIDDEIKNQDKLKEQVLMAEKDVQEFESNKGSKLKELKKEIEQGKKNIVALETQMNNKFNSFQDFQFDIEKLSGDLDALKENIKEDESNIEELKTEIDGMTAKLNEFRDKHSVITKEIEIEKNNMLGLNKEINELTKLLNAKDKNLNSCKLKSQKMAHELEKSASTAVNLKKHVDSLLSEHEWLSDENMVISILQQNPNINVSECHTRINYLTNKFQGMKRKVNANIMSMIDNVEKKETSLKTMIKTIEKDKAKIEETIVTLDEYKRETLVKTWHKVSKDFGAIFADLLPGAFAKLVIPENKDITEGLEVKVMLGKVWKESLVELSGGQRSLVALSLIMALLQFKPAPMYILDEVDAALDLSHTQNIGHLIKTRFKGSQFIVVSLKEGMFSNANRVFRTRFQDGTSVVSIM